MQENHLRKTLGGAIILGGALSSYPVRAAISLLVLAAPAILLISTSAAVWLALWKENPDDKLAARLAVSSKVAKTDPHRTGRSAG
jgi:hypothetical protein